MDKIEFARFISLLSQMTGHAFADHQIRDIDALLTEARKGGPQDARDLIRCIAGDRKIDAIKHYRTLTGDGLKESKDAVETVLQCKPWAAA